MKKKVILFATVNEAEAYLAAISAKQISNWQYESENISILITGVGKVNAASKTAWAIHNGAVEIINAGISGCLNNNHSLFKVFNPNKFFDLDRSKGLFINEPISLNSKDLIAIGTTDSPIHGSMAKLDAVEICELIDMESYAIVSVSLELSIEPIVIKCISDFCDENGSQTIKSNLPKASIILAEALLSLRLT